MSGALSLLGCLAFLACIYFAAAATARKIRKKEGCKANLKKALACFAGSTILLIASNAVMSPEEKAALQQEREQRQEQEQQAAKEKTAKEQAEKAKAAEEKAVAETAAKTEIEQKETKQIDAPVIHDVAAEKQAITDYVNSTAGAKYKIKNLNVSEYSDGVYQINFQIANDSGDADGAKNAAKEIRGLMSDFPYSVDTVSITFRGGTVGYSPSSPKMQIVAGGQKSEF